MFLLSRLFHLGEKPAATGDALLDDTDEASEHSGLPVFDTRHIAQAPVLRSKLKTHNLMNTSSQLLRNFGKHGSGKGQIDRPGGVAVTSQGDIVVVDTDNCRLHLYDSMGHLQKMIGEKGCGRNQLNQPMDICICNCNGDECFMVSDSVNACIKVFEPSGTCVEIFGDRDGIFQYPYGVCVSRDRHVIVTDICKQAIVVLNDNGNKVAEFGQYGYGSRDFNNPYYVTTDRENNIVVSDSGNMAVKIFTIEGILLSNFNVEDFHIYQEDFVMLQCITTDSDGNILIVANNTVYVVANNGRFWEVLSPSCGLDAPKGLAVSPLGHLVVTQDSADLDYLISIFRYPMENFRALRTISKTYSIARSTPVTNAAKLHQVSKAVHKVSVHPPANKHNPIESKQRFESQIVTSVDSVHSAAPGVTGENRSTVDSSARLLRKDSATLNRNLTYGRDYFLGPKRGSSRRNQPHTTVRCRHGNVDFPVEIETDIDRRLRTKRRLRTRPDRNQSPAHIFSFN